MSLQPPQDQIRELLARYIKGECTGHETALLEEWFERLTGERVHFTRIGDTLEVKTRKR